MNQFEEYRPGRGFQGTLLGGFGAAGKCLGALPPRVRRRGLVWSGTSVLCVARRSYDAARYKIGKLIIPGVLLR